MINILRKATPAGVITAVIFLAAALGALVPGALRLASILFL